MAEHEGTPDRIWDVLLSTRQRVEEQRGRALLPLKEAHSLAWFKAREYIARGSAFADYQPRNGTAYKFALFDLVDVQAKALLERKLEIRDRPWEDRRALLADCRADTAARFLGPAYSWGGELLVALPENSGGRSRCFGMTGYFEAGYVADQFDLHPHDAVAVSEFLTLFGSMVIHLRAGDEPVTAPRRSEEL